MERVQAWDPSPRGRAQHAVARQGLVQVQDIGIRLSQLLGGGSPRLENRATDEPEKGALICVKMPNPDALPFNPVFCLISGRPAKDAHLMTKLDQAGRLFP